ncbi:MAG: hypothetical protein HYV02_00325 [Deltaproteobacteria bacterium]|nr:hypothetical protein [Deltaproteobacteria bacterium]
MNDIILEPDRGTGHAEIPQSNLSRPLLTLRELHLVEHELPFGESVRTTKRVRYYITDPALAFYTRRHK